MARLSPILKTGAIGRRSATSARRSSHARGRRHGGLKHPPAVRRAGRRTSTDRNPINPESIAIPQSLAGSDGGIKHVRSPSPAPAAHPAWSPGACGGKSACARRDARRSPRDSGRRRPAPGRQSRVPGSGGDGGGIGGKTRPLRRRAASAGGLASGLPVFAGLRFPVRRPTMSATVLCGTDAPSARSTGRCCRTIPSGGI
jgi:hypothetical protein